MSTQHSRAPMGTGTASVASADPLWGLVCVLGDIARRRSTRRAEEHVEQTPETRNSVGSEPAAFGEERA